MGKTADLTVVQKTTIDTLHKEGKTQKVIIIIIIIIIHFICGRLSRHSRTPYNNKIHN